MKLSELKLKCSDLYETERIKMSEGGYLYDVEIPINAKSAKEFATGMSDREWETMVKAREKFKK